MFTYIQEIIKKGGVLVDDELLDLETTNLISTYVLIGQQHLLKYKAFM